MWDWGYAWDILPELLTALRMTVLATAGGFLVAAIGGLLLVYIRFSSFRLLALAARGGMEFIRSTPLLIQVFFLYYTLPMISPVSMNAFTVGILGLGIHYSTYMAEVYRSGIEAVPKGQWEAASALNFTKIQTWRKIVLPQALPPVIPVMGNYLIVMFKETPILSAITLMELLLTAKNIVSESYRFFEPYTLVGLLFLLVSYPASLAVVRLEKRLALTPNKETARRYIRDSGRKVHGHP